MSIKFSIDGNVCGKRIRLARAMQDPPITMKDLAERLHFLGMESITERTLSRIERGERHVIDEELRRIAQVLNVSMDWLVGDTDDPTRHVDKEQGK